MAFTDTRSGPGTLLLGSPGAEHGWQVTSITLTPAVDSTDGTPTLAVPDPPPETSTTYTLDGSAINDYSNPTGLQRYCYDNDGDEVDFVYTSSTVAGEGAILTGKVIVRAYPMGGAVGEQGVVDFSWPCSGKPVWSTGAAREAAKSGAAK